MADRGNRGAGRGVRKLTPQQQILLDTVQRADSAWRDAKLTLKQRLRQQLEEELNRFAMARDKAVYEAVEGDVPKSRITVDGLRTSPNAVYDAYERHAHLVAEPGLPEEVRAPEQRFTVTEYAHPNGRVYLVADAVNPHPIDMGAVGLEGEVDGWLFALIGDEWIPSAGYYEDIPDETWAWWVDNRPE